MFLLECRGSRTLNVKDVCYHLELENRLISLNEIDRECSKKNLTMPDFPTFDKQFLINILRMENVFGETVYKKERKYSLLTS